MRRNIRYSVKKENKDVRRGSSLENKRYLSNLFGKIVNLRKGIKGLFINNYRYFNE
jgi:hypothetical protein